MKPLELQSKMKQEDIDKKIGMPDVDAEWAKFEREVIGREKASRKPLYWGIGIAASIVLVAGFFLFGHDIEEPQQTIAQQTTTTMQVPSTEETAIEVPAESIALPEKDVPTIVETKQRPSSRLFAEATPPTTEETANDELQGRIAGLNDIPDSVRQARRDSLLRQREINMDSMLIVVNGTPIPLCKFNRKGIAPYLYKQHQLLSDSDLNVEERISRGVYQPYGGSEEERKRRCFEIYGDRAKYGVIEVTTVPDTYCDAYISKHPELKKERHHIEGFVYNEDDKPLADAWVHVRDKGIGAPTDSAGHFSFWLPRKDVTIQASCLGYITVRITQPANTTLTIRMKSAVRIREVKVIPKKEREEYIFHE